MYDTKITTDHKILTSQFYKLVTNLSTKRVLESGKMKKVPIVSHHNIVLYRTILNI